MSEGSQQFSGRSAAEAAIKACEALGTTRSSLTYEVISDEGEGLNRSVTIEVSAEMVTAAREAPAASSAEGAEEAPRRDSGDKRRGRRGGRGERSERGDRPRREGRSDRRRGGRRQEAQNDDGGGIDALLNLETVPEEAPQARPEVEDALSAKAALAKQVLLDVLRLMGLEVNPRVVEDGEQEITVDLSGTDEKQVIGARGEVLLSLQFLVNRMVSREAESDAVVVLDAAGYRERRRDALSDLARKLAERAVEEEKAVRLSAMSAHDRRVIHLTLADRDDVTTRSEGDGLYRRLLIVPSHLV